MELCLGTVQLGMNYGVQKIKQPTTQKALEILNDAVDGGIAQIDTAEAYGNAEEIVGLFLKQRPSAREKLKIISKLRPNILDEQEIDNYCAAIRMHLERSLQTLHVNYLDAYLLHSSRYVFNDHILEALQCFKKEGLVRSVGVSVYESDEALQGVASPLVDFLQLPYSLLDQRMADAAVFTEAQKTHTMIHIRSVFLQGLLMMDVNKIPKHLGEVVPYIKQFQAVCAQKNLSPTMVALQFAKQQEAQAMVFGVDTVNQLEEDMAYFHQKIDENDLNEIASIFPVFEAKLIMPSLWTKQ